MLAHVQKEEMALLPLLNEAMDADTDQIEALAAKVQRLADGWDRPADAPDPVDLEVSVPVPDDSSVDHTGEVFDRDS